MASIRRELEARRHLKAVTRVEPARPRLTRWPCPPPEATALHDSLANWFVAVAARCLHEHGLRLEIIGDDQNYTAEWLRSGSVLGAITAEAAAVRGCQVEPRGAMRYRATTSPAFVRRWFAGAARRGQAVRPHGAGQNRGPRQPG